ncbi:FAD-dependent oxidoreductase [Maritalea sp. S77]|uniref:FAD-dependent oxidoreductase n=1 Tax=Maritalea sp. S77 TaxID=3415125 RepID=UPI003C7DC87E
MSKRIAQIGNHRFAHLVDLERPISVRLNDRTLTACFGDTLYSALVANGITEVVGPNSEMLSLSATLPLFARHRNSKSPFHRVLVSDLVLHDGDELELDFAPLGAWTRFNRFIRRQNNPPLAMNWQQNTHFDLPHSNSLVQRTVVIGAGISGMQAAIEAANVGHQVYVLEKDQLLGGMCAYYGKSTGETEPVELIDKLVERLESLENISVFTGTKALDIRNNRLLMQHSLFQDDEQRTELSWLKFDHLVIATGGDHHGFTLDNHLPHRVLDSKDAFHDLWAYGLVRYNQNLLYTVENGAYRLAMHLKEAGLELLAAYDGRTGPNSRHIEFAKAVGVKMGSAVHLQSLAALPTKIQCHFAPTHFEAQHQQFQIESEALLVGYPPQPDNYLWVKAGGQSQLDSRTGRILPNVGPAHVAIVGTAAGYSSQTDCLTSVDEAMSILGKRGLIDGASQVHNSQVYESSAAYRHQLPTPLQRRNAAFYNYPEATNYFLRALPVTDQTLRQYFANGYFEDAKELDLLSFDAPKHFKNVIENGHEIEIVSHNDERLRVGQMLFVAGQEGAEKPLGVITQILDDKIIAFCDRDQTSTGLNISVERRNGLFSPARIGDLA